MLYSNYAMICVKLVGLVLDRSDNVFVAFPYSDMHLLVNILTFSLALHYP